MPLTAYRGSMASLAKSCFELTADTRLCCLGLSPTPPRNPLTFASSLGSDWVLALATV